MLCARPRRCQAPLPAPGARAGTGGLDPAARGGAGAGRGLPSLHALLVARHGAEHVGQVFRGPGARSPGQRQVGVEVGDGGAGRRGIERGVLAGRRSARRAAAGRPRAGRRRSARRARSRSTICSRCAPGSSAPRGATTARWVASTNWVRYALSRPFVDEPGGRMLYSTGSYHLLSAVLTRASGKSTLALAAAWLGAPLGDRDPALDPRPAGLLSRRQQHGARAARAAALRRDVPQRRHLRRPSVLPDELDRGVLDAARPLARSPATPTATAGFSPRRAGTGRLSPGATAGR